VAPMTCIEMSDIFPPAENLFLIDLIILSWLSPLNSDTMRQFGMLLILCNFHMFHAIGRDELNTRSFALTAWNIKGHRRIINWSRLEYTTKLNGLIIHAGSVWQVCSTYFLVPVYGPRDKHKKK
jgi:hypothetical protein